MGRVGQLDQVTNPLGDPALEESYRRYVDSLEPCPGCGRVDEMDNIEGRLLCAACSLDEHDDDECADQLYDQLRGELNSEEA